MGNKRAHSVADSPILVVNDLSVAVDIAGEEMSALSHVSFQVGRREILGIIGESGCGKSLTALSIMGLLPRNAKIVDGEIEMEGVCISTLSEPQMRKIRGKQVGMIFQEPLSALNPLMRVGRQVEEVLTIHGIGNRKSRRDRVLELFQRVGLSDPQLRTRQFPHQLSGGMRQRVMIAMAMAGDPKLLIADEPTTALDVTVQAQILDLLLEIRSTLDASVILVTHDMGVIAEVADRVIVMYGGQVVESASVGELFANPSHPYSVGLLQSSLGSGYVDRDRDLPTIKGRVPALGEMPNGCPFAPRCERSLPTCDSDVPKEMEVNADHSVRCWNPVTGKVDFNGVKSYE